MSNAARGSLRQRLMLVACSWIVLAVAISAWVLIVLFENHITRRFDNQLSEQLDELAAGVKFDTQGAFQLPRQPIDPRFNRPRSGWYWQISQDGGVLASSRSLWRDRLRPDSTRSEQTWLLAGPANEPLRGLSRELQLPRATHPVLFSVAGPQRDISDDVALFTRELMLTLGVLVIGLAAAVWLQIRYGLRPLALLQQSIARLRTGIDHEIQADVPQEVSPLVRELNALLTRNHAMLERARRQAADLAHALKNPLTVISGEAHAIGGDSGTLIEQQTSSMGIAIERHLTRARIAAGHRAPGANTPLPALLDDLVFSLDRLYRERALQISHDIEPLAIAVDSQDAEEIVGNLLDNACKWAADRIVVEAHDGGERVRITIDDDGPGLAEADRERVLTRGLRLDEATPGSGMGLAIAHELCEAYGGSLNLQQSPLGGLRAEVALPAAESPSPLR